MNVGKASDATLARQYSALQKQLAAVVTEQTRRKRAACRHDWQHGYDRDAPAAEKSFMECSMCHTRVRS